MRCVRELSQSHPVCGWVFQDQVCKPSSEQAQLLGWRGWTTVHFTQLRHPVGGSEITTGPICTHLQKDKLLWFLQGTNPAKQTSSPSLIKWWWAIKHGDCPNCPFPLACEAELESWLFLAMMTSYKNIQFRSSFKLLMPSCTKVFTFLPSSTDWSLVHFQLELETAVDYEAAAKL